MSSNTADPKSARAHARAQGGSVAEAMPILPASASRAIPAGVASEAMLWDETIAAGGYGAKRLDRGARLRLVDLHGDACVSMLIFNAEQHVERLNVADTLKVQWNAYLGPGSLLLSDMGRVLMSILDDDTRGHDALCGPSNAASNARAYGDGANHGPHPNARDRFVIAAAKYGLGRKDIHASIAWFKPVRVSADGALAIDVGPFQPGRAVTLRAEMNIIVILANCPHVRDPRPDYTVTPARAIAWRGPTTTIDDPIRIGAPEAERAFLNVDDYFAR